MAIFRKTLSSADIGRRLTIPGEYAAEFPPFHGDHHNEIKVKDAESGHQLIFRCAPQPGTNSGIVITQGWPQFISRKNLKDGDIIHFKKELDYSTGAYHYTIGVTRNRTTISE